MEASVGLKAYAGRVDVRLAELLPPATDLPSPLHEAMRYSALAPGKRIRPALAMACSHAVGGQPDDALDVGCAVELVHVFSLIHDDLPALDNDDLRRGRPTCHVAFGESTAILAGDALFALAFKTLAATGPSADAVTLLAETALNLVRGESLDLLSEGQPADARTLEFIHRNKTGALISCACALGAMAGGGSPEDVAALRRYGEQVGLAFQIADDVLNETADAAQLGKSAGSDRDRGKLTYPAVYGLERAVEESERCVRDALAELERFDARADDLRWLARFTVERRT